MRNFRLLLLLLLSGCGGGGGGGALPSANAPVSATVPPGSNVMSLYSAPASVNINILLASIKLCTPNTSNCQVIPNILVDTGSYGIRLLKSAVPSSLQLSQIAGSGGNPIFECTQFASGYTWGSVQSADVVMAGETAYGLPLQVIDDVSSQPSPAAPSSCTSVGKSIGNAAAMNANGILGIGFSPYDCGQFCSILSSNNIYFECPSSGCVSHAEPLNLQVKNPVPLFASDNNGIVIVLPQVPATGAPSLAGSLIFGIGTRTNNALGQTAVIPLNASGNFTTVLNGKTFPNSFIDSGTNLLIFQDGATPLCTTILNAYCPTSTRQFTATLQGGASSVSVNFSVVNGDALNTTGNVLFNDIAGNTADATSFNWGLPFFFGRSVYFAFSGAMTPAGSGPFVAF